MAKRKPRVEYYWSPVIGTGKREHQVNWRLVGGNGEIMCQSTQGFRDKTDAQRSVDNVAAVFAELTWVDGKPVVGYREVGPGKKPEVTA